MTFLVTGSSGHLGEALVRTLQDKGQAFTSLDIKPGAFTSCVGSITNAYLVRTAMRGVKTVFHAATLHKPHVVTHSAQDFIDVNISGTKTLLDAAVKAGVEAFIFTSTTSVFGHAMKPKPGGPAVWVDETLPPEVKNIYGATKLAAETLCELAHNEAGLNVIILRVSRFFPEDDDNKSTRDQFRDSNVKANEFLNRRADIEDMVSAHFKASKAAPRLGFDRFIISAPTPFQKTDINELRKDAPTVLSQYVDWRATYERLGWTLPQSLDRVYDSAKAQSLLDWHPQHDFQSVINRAGQGGAVLSELAQEIGKKGYHDQRFDLDGPYPV
jgi:nucleoside-diphosphate-sugar epimerase